jgi:hypothetical protein
MEPDAHDRLVARVLTVLSYLAVFVGGFVMWYVLYTWIWEWIHAAD